MPRLTLILIVVFTLAFFTVAAQDNQVSVSPEPTNVIVTGEYGLSLEIEGFEQRTVIDSHTPDQDIYLIMFGILHNDDSSPQCIYAHNVRLIWNNREYAPQNGPMGAVKETLDPTRDFIGAYQGQCLDANSSEPTFVVFDIPLKTGDVEIKLFDNTQPIKSVWVEQLSSSPIITDTPTPESLTYYINSSNPVNIRSCGALYCDVVTTSNSGEAIQIIDNVGDWYKVRLDDNTTGYIAAFLVSETKPVIKEQSAQPVIRPTSAPIQATIAQPQIQPTQPPLPTQPPAQEYACNCSKTCGEMTCEEAYFQLQQCGCSRRDDDKDGVPCESICPGG